MSTIKGNQVGQRASVLWSKGLIDKMELEQRPKGKRAPATQTSGEETAGGAVRAVALKQNVLAWRAQEVTKGAETPVR